MKMNQTIIFFFDRVSAWAWPFFLFSIPASLLDLPWNRVLTKVFGVIIDMKHCYEQERDHGS